MKNICPSCGSPNVKDYYRVKNIPVHSVILLHNKDEAQNCPKGDITLGFCQYCGFIFNMAFDQTLQEYSSNYESTQGYSPTYNTFAEHLAENLIDRFDLHRKEIIEIGCGQGEFLTLLCKLGGNRGVGFDPAYVSKPNDSSENYEITFIKDFYSGKYADISCDFLCCRMTMEHIREPGFFLQTLQKAIKKNPNAQIFIQVPDVVRILRDLAFWDIYYEHCSYFSPGSLVRLFEKNGFEVNDMWKEYNDQYIMLCARQKSEGVHNPILKEDSVTGLQKDVQYFTKNYKQQLNKWNKFLRDSKKNDYRVVLWGGGSKGVAFLTTLGIQDEIEYVVDINPKKFGTFMAGTGHEVVSPEFLAEYKPDFIIVMNPIYKDEIQSLMKSLGLSPKYLYV